jgi:hypothetical protein
MIFSDFMRVTCIRLAAAGCGKVLAALDFQFIRASALIARISPL